MTTATAPSIDSLIPHATGPGFVSIPGAEFRALVGEAALKDWAGLASSWNELDLDHHMADGGRSRRRRFARFSAVSETISREPHAPHFYSGDYNHLNGGVDRWFAPVTDAITEPPVTKRLLALCLQTFTKARGEAQRGLPWSIEMHQFRIEPKGGAPGTPTPEGMHRDGVDWVFVALVARVNVLGGVTTVGDATGCALGAFTLSEPLDAVFLDDVRVRHGVTQVRVLQPDQKAYRDVLVFTFRERTN